MKPQKTSASRAENPPAYSTHELDAITEEIGKMRLPRKSVSFAIAKEINYAMIMNAKQMQLDQFERVLGALQIKPGKRNEAVGENVELMDEQDESLQGKGIDPGTRSAAALIREGGSLTCKGDSTGCADTYLQAWVHIKKSIHDHAGDWQAVDKLLATMDVDLIDYVADFMMGLHNAGLDDDKYFRKLIEIGNEIPILLKGVKRGNFVFQTERDIAEAYFHIGDSKTGNERFSRITTEHPGEIWGYIGWGDQLAADPSVEHHDYPKAEMLYLKALDLMIQEGMKDDEDLSLRFEELYERTGTPEKLEPILQKMKARGIQSRLIDDPEDE